MEIKCSCYKHESTKFNYKMPCTKKSSVSSSFQIWKFGLLGLLQLSLWSSLASFAWQRSGPRPKTSFSEISTSSQLMRQKVTVWKTWKEIQNVQNLLPYSRNGYLCWKRWNMLSVINCDQNENGDDWQACSQMNDTNRVDQKPRKWSVNPQHKLVGLLLFFPSLQCILVDVHVVWSQCVLPKMWICLRWCLACQS